LGFPTANASRVAQLDIDGKTVDLGKTYGNVPAVLVVNLASA
jgi:hypothetical protein